MRELLHLLGHGKEEARAVERVAAPCRELAAEERGHGVHDAEAQADLRVRQERGELGGEGEELVLHVLGFQDDDRLEHALREARVAGAGRLVGRGGMHAWLGGVVRRSRRD